MNASREKAAEMHDTCLQKLKPPQQRLRACMHGPNDTRLDGSIESLDAIYDRVPNPSPGTKRQSKWFHGEIDEVLRSHYGGTSPQTVPLAGCFCQRRVNTDPVASFEF